MKWTKPKFQEISLNMEVRAYVNTDDKLLVPQASQPGDKAQQQAAPARIPAERK